jgi:D-3-phosphoglycerate dehydrogenase
MIRWQSPRIEAALAQPPNVFVHEMLDPSHESLTWLEERGVDVKRGVPTWGEDFYTEDELIEEALGYRALMGASTHRITRRVIESLPDLAFISKFGIGVDSIDMQAATDNGVLVTNTPIQENVEAVGDYAVGAMLYLLKQFGYYTSSRLASGGWRTGEAWGSFLWGKKVGLIGFGRIGKAVARRLQGWDVELLVHDPFVDGADVRARGGTPVSFEELLRDSDIISLHTVANASNRHMINDQTLALVKHSAILINSARGALVDLDALNAALIDDRIAGAALDAFETEPPPIHHPIFQHPRVLATPHSSAWVYETFVKIGETGARNLWSAFSGEIPEYAVNATDLLAK